MRQSHLSIDQRVRSVQLAASEARAIAASIHRWITTKSRMWADGPAVYEATFSTIQAARGRKSGQQRAQHAAEKWEVLR